MPQYDDEFYIRYILNSTGSYGQTNYRLIKILMECIGIDSDKKDIRHTLADFMAKKEELLAVTHTFVLSYNLYCHPHLILPLHHLFLQAITFSYSRRLVDNCFRTFYVTTKAD